MQNAVAEQCKLVGMDRITRRLYEVKIAVLLEFFEEVVYNFGHVLLNLQRTFNFSAISQNAKEMDTKLRTTPAFLQNYYITTNPYFLNHIMIDPFI